MIMNEWIYDLLMEADTPMSATVKWEKRKNETWVWLYEPNSDVQEVMSLRAYCWSWHTYATKENSNYLGRKVVTNTVGPNQAAQREQSDQGLQYLPVCFIRDYCQIYSNYWNLLTTVLEVKVSRYLELKTVWYIKS